MWSFEVPNAPCGVERWVSGWRFGGGGGKFLMHRVELKEVLSCNLYLLKFQILFLMHRVELKDDFVLWLVSAPDMFLMHRVELKV